MILSKAMEKPARAARRRLLVVDDEPGVAEMIRDVLGRSLDCQSVCAHSVAEARQAMQEGRIDLLVADLCLPDGDGMGLLASLRERNPHAGAVVITGSGTMDTAIHAMRHGADDFIPKPFDADQLVERVRQALARQAGATERRRRIGRLRKAVRKLSDARKHVSKKVDLLCNDLINAYSDLARQFDTVRLQEGYRQFAAGTADLEQLLCHSMDWLLRQIGYANVGVWLAVNDREFHLGAYMKYTIPGEPALTEAIEKNLVGMAIRKGFVRIGPDTAQQTLSPAELRYLAKQDILATNCTYLAETLAVLVVFRDATQPFTEADLNALKTMTPLFALSLARAVRDTEGPGEDGPFKDPKQKGRPDPADWWKRGEPPPF